MNTSTTPEAALAATLTPKREKRTVLSHQEFYKLCEWLRGCHKEVLAEPTTLVALADLASERLSTKISESAIGTALDATDLRKRAILPNGKAHLRGKQDEVLVEAVKVLAEALQMVLRGDYPMGDAMDYEQKLRAILAKLAR